MAKKQPIPTSRELSIVPQQGVFMWNYTLEVEWEEQGNAEQSGTDGKCIFTARLNWVYSDIKVDPGLPIRFEKGALNVLFNLQKIGHGRFEAIETEMPIPCPNFPEHACHTVVTFVANPESPDERVCCYSYLIEGKGYQAEDITHLLHSLEAYHLEYLKKAEEKLPKGSDATLLGLHDARATLLARIWPSLFKALEDGAAQSDLLRAFLIDTAANFGRMPRTGDAESLLKDRAFITALNQAYQGKGYKPNPVDIHLYLNWYSHGYYALSDAELAEQVNASMGTKFKPRTLAKRAERLGLTTDRPQGPKPRDI